MKLFLEHTAFGRCRIFACSGKPVLNAISAPTTAIETYHTIFTTETSKSYKIDQSCENCNELNDYIKAVTHSPSVETLKKKNLPNTVLLMDKFLN